MTTITIALPDERQLELHERAVQYSVSPEELVLISIEDLLSRPDKSFEQNVDYVISKERVPLSAVGVIRYLTLNEVLP